MRLLLIAFLITLTTVTALASGHAEAPYPVGTGAWLKWEATQHNDPEAQGSYDGAVIACVVIMLHLGVIVIPPTKDWRGILDDVEAWLLSHSFNPTEPLDNVVYQALYDNYATLSEVK